MSQIRSRSTSATRSGKRLVMQRNVVNSSHNAKKSLPLADSMDLFSLNNKKMFRESGIIWSILKMCFGFLCGLFVFSFAGFFIFTPQLDVVDTTLISSGLPMPSVKPNLSSKPDIFNLGNGSLDLLVSAVLGLLFSPDSLVHLSDSSEVASDGPNAPPLKDPVEVTRFIWLRRLRLFGFNSLAVACPTRLVVMSTNQQGLNQKQNTTTTISSTNTTSLAEAPIRDLELTLCVSANNLILNATMESWLPTYAIGNISVKLLPVTVRIKLLLLPSSWPFQEWRLSSHEPLSAQWLARATEVKFIRWTGVHVATGKANGEANGESNSWSQRLVAWLTNGAAWIASGPLLGRMEVGILKALNKQLVHLTMPSALFTKPETMIKARTNADKFKSTIMNNDNNNYIGNAIKSTFLNIQEAKEGDGLKGKGSKEISEEEVVNEGLKKQTGIRMFSIIGEIVNALMENIRWYM